jgi:hypothetical protein
MDIDESGLDKFLLERFQFVFVLGRDDDFDTADRWDVRRF